MISAPSETRCRSMPKISMHTKVIASTSGIDNATTVPVRKPRLRKDTTRTMTTASLSEATNRLIDSRTTSG